MSFGTPPCLSDLTADQQVGFIKPYIQFGRGPGVPLFAISSSVKSESSFNRIKLASAEFHTGKMIVTLEEYDPSTSLSTNFVKLYKEENGKLVLLDHDFNSFVIEDLNLNMTVKEPNERGDVRLFKYPNGEAGAFLERTGQFFKLEELADISPSKCTPIPPGEYLSDIAIKATPAGQVPAINTGPGSYNMAVAEGFDKVLFIDQKEGLLYSHDPSTRKTTKIFDVATDKSLPSNIDVNHGGPKDFATYFATAFYKIHKVSPGPNSNSIYVVFTSNTLPNNVPAALALNMPKLPQGTDDASTNPYKVGPRVSIYARCL